MNRIEWPDADHPRSVPNGSAWVLPSGDKVVVCGSHLDRDAQIKLCDWLTQHLEASV